MIKLFNRLFASSPIIKGLEARFIAVEKKVDTLTTQKIKFDEIENSCFVVSNLYENKETKMLIKDNGDLAVKGNLIIRENKEER